MNFWASGVHSFRHMLHDGNSKGRCDTRKVVVDTHVATVPWSDSSKHIPFILTHKGDSLNRRRYYAVA